jgi:hypothetical protein
MEAIPPARHPQEIRDGMEEGYLFNLEISGVSEVPLHRRVWLSPGDRLPMGAVPARLRALAVRLISVQVFVSLNPCLGLGFSLEPKHRAPHTVGTRYFDVKA